MANHDPQADTGKDIVHTDKNEVSCDGDGGVSGHPKVFLHMENGRVDCPYCDRAFILQQDAD